MKTISIHSDDRILRVVTCADEYIGLQIKPGESWIEGEYPDDTHYIVAAEPVARPGLGTPEVISAAAGDTVEISTDLPAETFVAIDGVAMGVVDDGELEIEIARPGVMHVRLTPPWPHRPAEIRIEADEAAAS